MKKLSLLEVNAAFKGHDFSISSQDIIRQGLLKTLVDLDIPDSIHSIFVELGNISIVLRYRY